MIVCAREITMAPSISFAEHRIDQTAWHPVALNDTETSWRDFVEELTPDQIGRLEEIASEMGERPTGVMLGLARWFAAKTALDATIGDVLAPTGVTFIDSWHEGATQPYRMLLSAERGVESQVWTSAVQFADGSIDLAGSIEPPLIHVGVGKDGMTAAQVRDLIAALAGALDHLDGRTRWTPVSASTSTMTRRYSQVVRRDR
ncbi:hypothetical protein [Mycobacterium numidiamassiliense]|nr:hypothetical protein [Mycobacterium numidiamassiliense]